MRLKFILAMWVMLFTIACKTKKNIVTETLTADDIIQVIEKKQLRYSDWYAKGQISFNSPEMGISGHFTARIKRDSAMLLSFRKLGMEWAKVWVDQEKYTLINRWERTTETGFLSEFRQLFPFDTGYSDLENVLCGNVLVPDKATSAVQLRNETYILQFSKEGYDVTYLLNKEDLTIREATVTDKDRILARLTWNDFKPVEGAETSHPFYRSIEVFSDSEEPTVIEIQVSRMDINDMGALYFSIPEDYEKL